MGSKSKSRQSTSSQNVSQSQGVNSGVNMNYGFNQSGNFGQNSSAGGSRSLGGSAGGGSSFNRSTQDVYGAQAPYLQDVYGAAQGAFNQGMADVQGIRPGVQQQLGDALAAAGDGYGNQLGGGFAAGLAGQVGPNSYVDALKGQIADDAMRLKQQNLGSLDARAAAAGMSGSSGYRDQVNAMAEDVDRNALAQMSQLGYNSFDRGVQNQMQLAAMQDANQQAGLGNLQNIQQASLAQFQPAMLGQQMAGAYGQTVGGPTVLGQSSGASNNFNNSFNTANSFNRSQGTNMGFSNGLQMGIGVNGGFNAANSLGSSTGQGSSSSTTIAPETGGAFATVASKALPLMGISDARLKENIKHVEQIDGINMYTWDWKDPAVSSAMNYGVIAQEVAETHPEAVVTGDHGYMMVDYSKLGRAGQAASRGWRAKAMGSKSKSKSNRSVKTNAAQMDALRRANPFLTSQQMMDSQQGLQNNQLGAMAEMMNQMANLGQAQMAQNPMLQVMQAYSMLPPGVASDKDVQMAMSPMNNPFSAPQQPQAAPMAQPGYGEQPPAPNPYADKEIQEMIKRLRGGSLR